MSLDPIAIVPARLASTRLPDKPLADLGGAPLIVRVCENVAAAGVFCRVVVACDSARVAQAVTAAGFEAMLTAPALPSGTDRVAAAAAQLSLEPAQLVVNVQGDEPFVSRQALAALVDAFRQNRSPVTDRAARDGNLARPGGTAKGATVGDPHIATVVEPLTVRAALDDPNVVKAVLGVGGRALYFSRAPVPYDRDTPGGAPAAQHYRHVGLYAFRADALAAVAALPEHPVESLERLEQLRWLAHGYTIHCVTAPPGARGIDTPADLERARADYARRRSL